MPKPPGSAPIAHKEPGSRRRSTVIWTIGGTLCVTLILAFVLYRGISLKNRAAHSPPAALPQKSIAVLPFLDLTADMKEEEFADGLTEEIIDKLSKVPGIRVPAATASFYFKYKKIPVAEIARTLGVVYVLDGSTRRSDESATRIDRRRPQRRSALAIAEMGEFRIALADILGV